MSAYSEKFKDPRWQKRRLEVLQRDSFTCRECGSSTETLHVHHLLYLRDKDPWDYELHDLVTLCYECHEFVTDFGDDWQELASIARFRGLTSDDMRKWLGLDPKKVGPYVAATRY